MGTEYGVTVEEHEDARGLWKRLKGTVTASYRYTGEIMAYQALGLAATPTDDVVGVTDRRWPSGDAPYTSLRIGDDDTTPAERYLKDEVIDRMDDPEEATYHLEMTDGEDRVAYTLEITLPDDATWRDEKALGAYDFELFSTIPLDAEETAEDLLARYNIPVERP